MAVSLISVATIIGCASTEDHKKSSKLSVNAATLVFADRFEGDWVGELRPIGTIDAPFKAVGWNETLRVRIKQGKAEIFHRYDDHWKPSYPTRFSTNIHGPNAVIYMQNVAADIEDKSGFGGWAESHVLILTLKDDNTLYVSAQRAVSNFLKKHDEENSRFFTFFVGELSRTGID